ncbi:MAG TPA: septum formation initiator family protein [Patescibacteria group bacterium]|nr:septum formation initiator family protein [Patescibacteria group bacterium]
MKRIIIFAIIIFLFAVTINLALSIASLWSKKDILTQTRLELAKKQEEHARLEKDWQHVNSPSFVEEQARDKLFLAEPGESVVLMPKASASAAQLVQTTLNEPVWEQWVHLFF